MHGRSLGTRRYAIADQERFAALTGDYNPLHLDPVAARRALFGEPVVHGMHNVAWALDRYLANRPVGIARLAVTFPRPAFLGETLEARLIEERDDGARIQVVHNALTLADLKLRFTGRAAASAGSDRPRSDASRRTPRTLSSDDLPGLSGAIDGGEESGALPEAFPWLCAVLGHGRVVQLLSLSRLVGMECPGLHSLFSGFRVEFGPGGGSEAVKFEVVRMDPRFSMIEMRVSADGIDGTVSAFLRPPPAAQPDAATVRRSVRPDEFFGQRALVVGGSRGLGEVTAKIVAAGGGHPVITYRNGEEDAARVADEIAAGGGRCDHIRLDVAKPNGAFEQLAEMCWSPTHLYYFATPQIFVRKVELFEIPLFRRFLAVYVDGFLDIYNACRGLTEDSLRVFYPSSVAVDEDLRELAEYVAAKVAGEALCRQIDRFEPKVRVAVERLPRVATDQTATLMQVPAADPLELMLPIVRGLVADRNV